MVLGGRIPALGGSGALPARPLTGILQWRVHRPGAHRLLACLSVLASFVGAPRVETDRRPSSVCCVCRKQGTGVPLAPLTPQLPRASSPASLVLFVQFCRGPLRLVESPGEQGGSWYRAERGDLVGKLPTQDECKLSILHCLQTPNLELFLVENLPRCPRAASIAGQAQTDPECLLSVC